MVAAAEKSIKPSCYLWEDTSGSILERAHPLLQGVLNLVEDPSKTLITKAAGLRAVDFERIWV